MTVVQRTVRWLLTRRLEQLHDVDLLADLAPYRKTVDDIREHCDGVPRLIDALEQLECEISRREEIRARAKRCRDSP